MATKVNYNFKGDPLDLEGFGGVTPLNATQWLCILTDLAENLYSWSGNLDFYSLLLIEKYIFSRTDFALIQTKFRIGNAIVKGSLQILPVVPLTYKNRYEVKTLKVVLDKPVKGLVLNYSYRDFVYFDNMSNTIPYSLAQKYADMLAKLDALYMQNVDKLSIPIIAIGYKGFKNELLNIFKRSKLNALYAFVTGDNQNRDVNNLFFNPKLEFILDKLNAERDAIMKEYLQELGVNPNKSLNVNSQYVNDRAIVNDSLISKYFNAVLNKYRENFCKQVNSKFGIGLTFYQTVEIQTLKESANNDREQIDSID